MSIRIAPERGHIGRLVALVVLLALGCDRPGRMPTEVERGLSDFCRRAKWVKDLPPPAGASVSGLGGGGTAGDGSLFQFSVTTSQSAEDVLDHYSARLQARGWQPTQRLVEETVALETFQLSDEEATRWHGLLYTTAGDSGGGRVAVAIRVTRLPGLEPMEH